MVASSNSRTTSSDAQVVAVVSPSSSSSSSSSTCSLDRILLGLKREREVVDDHDDAGGGIGRCNSSGRVVRRRRLLQDTSISNCLLDVVSSSEEEEEKKEETIPELLTKGLWSDDETVVKATLTKLADKCMSRKNEFAAANSKIIYKAGGHAAIMGVMGKFNKSTCILDKGMRVLHNAASKNYRMIIGIGVLQGVKTIVEIMKSFVENKNIQRRACGAIATLIFKNKGNCQQLVQSDGISSILGAMTRFPDSEQLHRFACNALYSLAQGSEKWKYDVKDAGAEKIVASTLARHYANDDTRNIARRLLKVLLK